VKVVELLRRAAWRVWVGSADHEPGPDDGQVFVGRGAIGRLNLHLVVRVLGTAWAYAPEPS
jgi:hypothetical protein